MWHSKILTTKHLIYTNNTGVVASQNNSYKGHRRILFMTVSASSATYRHTSPSPSPSPLPPPFSPKRRGDIPTQEACITHVHVKRSGKVENELQNMRWLCGLILLRPQQTKQERACELSGTTYLHDVCTKNICFLFKRKDP